LVKGEKIMKSLIIADIHANLAAFEAVLEYERWWDEVIFLGDAVTYGPEPDKVLSLLAVLNGVFLMGNHDKDILDLDISVPPDNTEAEWSYWTRKHISPGNLRFMKSFIDSCGLKRQRLSLRLVHGELPYGKDGRLWPDTPEEVFGKLVKKYIEQYILIAHSHVQFKKVYDGKTIVNPGSIGQLRVGYPLACYAVLECGEFKLRGVPYDTEKTCKSMDKLPLDRELIEDWKEGFRKGIVPPRYNSKDCTFLRKMGYR